MSKYSQNSTGRTSFVMGASVELYQSPLFLFLSLFVSLVQSYLNEWPDDCPKHTAKQYPADPPSDMLLCISSKVRRSAISILSNKGNTASVPTSPLILFVELCLISLSELLRRLLQHTTSLPVELHCLSLYIALLPKQSQRRMCQGKTEFLRPLLE